MIRISSLRLALCGAAALALSPAAHAAGIAAGTEISNTAQATYNTSSGTATINSNTVKITVAELLDVTVAGTTTGSTTITPSGVATLTYAVTNTGNGNEAFKLTVDTAVAGNGFNATIDKIFIDANGNGVLDPGETQITNGGNSPALTPDQAVKVVVQLLLPAGATDEQLSKVKLTAEAATGTGTAGTLLAGKGDNGVDAVIGATTASGNAEQQLIASMAGVTLAKTYAIAGPSGVGGTAPVPGAIITYTLTAKVTGTGTAKGLKITDGIPTGTTYVASSLKLDGSALTDAADTDAGKAGSTGIEVALGDVTGGGADKVVTFQVKIN